MVYPLYVYCIGIFGCIMPVVSDQLPIENFNLNLKEVDLGVHFTEQGDPRFTLDTESMADALAIVVRLRYVDFSMTPALMLVFIQVLTLIEPVPSSLWGTVIVVSKSVVVVSGSNCLEGISYVDSTPPFMEI
jgi:hypothetical protein